MEGGKGRGWLKESVVGLKPLSVPMILYIPGEHT